MPGRRAGGTCARVRCKPVDPPSRGSPIHAMPNPIVAIVSSAMMSMLLLTLLGSLANSRVRGVREWMAANLLMATGLCLLLLRGHVPDFIVVLLANLLMAASAACFHVGCLRFMHVEPRWPRWAVLAGALVALAGAMAYWRYVVDVIQIRVFAMSVYLACVCGANARCMLRPRPPGRRRYPYYAIAAISAVCCAVQIVRGAYFLTLPGPSSPALLASVGSVVLSAVGAALMPMLSMAAMMLVHDELLTNANEMADRDYLTGLLSRKRFERIARAELARRAARRPVALLLIDFDYFKSINDVFGHAGGDAVLRDFASLASDGLHGEASFGRIGGEEFAVLLPGLDEHDAWQVGERLRLRVAAHTADTPAGPCRYTISGGVALAADGDSLERLYVRADRALYDAKQRGRNAICTAQAAQAAMEAVTAA